MKGLNRILLALLLLSTVNMPAPALQRDRFVYAQLRYAGTWDPYPEVSSDLLAFMEATTSIKPLATRRVLEIQDAELFSSPFLVVLGRDGFPALSTPDRERLRNYLLGGGTLFIEDVSGLKGSRFDRDIRAELIKIFPGQALESVPLSNAVYRSFYLLRGTGGRRIVSKNLEGIERSGRLCVVYSQNDLHGAWARDRLGNHLLECVPGGEPQRIEAKKLLANIIVFSVTGTYKTDVIHQPFIEQKLQGM